MRNLLQLLLIFLISCSSAEKSNIRDNFAEYKEVTLSNGLKVLMIKDNKLPHLTMTLAFESGSTSDPQGKEGLTTLMTGLLEKGTLKYSATELADQLALIGASLKSSVGSDYSTLQVSGLSWNQKKMLELFSEAILNPAFKMAEIGRLKKQIRAAIQNRSDDPQSFASYAFDKFLYKNYLYGRSDWGSLKTITTIKRSDILKHYQNAVLPNNSWLMVVGKYEPDTLQQLEKVFKDWKAKDAQAKLPEKWQYQPGRQVRLLEKDDLVQAQIRMGHPGIQRNNPDYLALKVVNVILGEGFNSRLMSRIRVQLGLTYSINSSFETNKYPGGFKILTFTKNKTVGTTIREILKIYEELVQKGVSKEEVQIAKAYMKGQFPQIVETADGYALNTLILKLYGADPNYLVNYYENLDKISKKDVNRVIKKYLSPENLRILVYASGSVKDQLSGISSIEVINYKDVK